MANPMGMILAVAALLHQAAEAGTEEAEPRSRAIYEAVFGAPPPGSGPPTWAATPGPPSSRTR